MTTFNVYRDGELIASGVQESAFVDKGLEAGSYQYQVTAVDEAGQESEKSEMALALVRHATGNVLKVGAGQTYSTFAAANAAANDGDTIQVYAGTYTNDWATINKNVTITGMGTLPSDVKFVSTSSIPGDEAIWRINANTVSISNIEMSGAFGASNNDAALKQYGTSLTLSRVWIHDCQMGILTANTSTQTLSLDTCEINNCGAGDPGHNHNLYAGMISSLTVNNCFMHDVADGHNIKSRALSTTVQNSRVYDNSGTASYSIDISQGGIAQILNNVIQQGTAAGNPTMIAFGFELPANPSPSLTVSGNTLVNDLSGSPIGVNNNTAAVASITGNSIYGLTSGQIASGPNSQSGNTTLGSRPTLDQTHPWGGGGVTATLIQQRPVQNFIGSATPGTFYKEIGAHFADNDTSGVPVGSIVEWRKSDGTTVLVSQGDVQRYWPSGRLRSYSATIKCSGAIASGGTDTWKAYSVTGSWNNTPWATTSVITAHDFRCEIVIGSTTYTMGFNNEINNRASTNVRQVRSGPRSCSWVIFGDYRNGTAFNSTAEGDLWCVAYVTFFDDGTYEIDPRIMCNRGNRTATFTTKGISSYALKDYNPATTLFSYATGFTAYVGGFWDHVNADGVPYYSGTSVDKLLVSFPTPVLSDPTTTGLYDSMMLHWLKTTSTEIAAMVDPTTTNWAPMTMPFISPADINGTGDSEWIGMITLRSAVAWTKKTWNAYRNDRIFALGEGAQPYWFWDSTNGMPYNLRSTAYTGLTQSTTINWAAGVWTPFSVAGGGIISGTSTDASHAPNWCWMQALWTGKEKWLDQLRGSAIGYLGGDGQPGSNWYNRGTTLNGRTYSGNHQFQMARAEGWYTRILSNAIWITPTSHVMYQYLLDCLTASNGHYAYLDERMTAPFADASIATLGGFATQESSGFPPGPLTWTSPWMHDYWALQMCMDIKRGLLSTSSKLVSQHLVKWILGRGVNGCMSSAMCYQLSIAPNTGVGLYGPLHAPIDPSGNTGYTFATAWSQVNGGDFSVAKVDLVPNGTTAGGNNVLHFASTTGVEDGMPVVHTYASGGTVNIPDFTTVVSHTGTTVTMSANATGTGIGTGDHVGFFKWHGALTNYDGVGCPSSGISSSNQQYGSGHDGFSYPILYQAVGYVAKQAGLTDGATIQAYLDTVEAGAGVLESEWAVQPQWRWRDPA